MFKKQPHSSKWSGKISEQAYALTLADMDFPLYPPFKQELLAQMQNLNNLTYKDRSAEYYESIIGWYKNHHHTQISQSDLVECPSICNLIGSSILAFTKIGGNVLIFTPVYSFYMNAVKALQRNVLVCGLKEVAVINSEESKDDKKGVANLYRYEFDAQNFKLTMDTYKPQLIILCNPHNPSGKIFTKEQLDLIVQKSVQHKTFILSDEIMGDFALFSSESSQNKAKFLTLAHYTYERIIVGNSISKAFNCSSIQGGYGIIKSQKVRNQFKQIGSKGLKLLTNEMGNIMTPIVYSANGPTWLQHVNHTIHQNYTLFTSTFSSQPYLKIFQLQSSYLTTIEFCFPQEKVRISNRHLSSLLVSMGMHFIDMQEYFYPRTERNVYRVAIAVSVGEFERFVGRFKGVMTKLNEWFGVGDRARL